MLLYGGAGEIPLSLWWSVLSRGLLFDAATSAYLLPAFLAGEALMPSRFRQTPWYSRLWALLFSFAIFLLLFLSASEVVFWDEFHTRFNFIALDYLIYTNEVVTNIWESYPVGWIVGVFALLSIAAGFFMGRRVASGQTRALARRERLTLLIVAVLLPVASAFGVQAGMMERHGNFFADELSGNGLFTLAAAARHNELDYDRFYATIPEDNAAAILKKLGVEWTDDLYRREHPHMDESDGRTLPFFLKRRPRNVVLISVESLSAKYVGVYGSQDGITPELDRLAKEGLMFAHVFATGTRTVRGLEALSLSTPPIPGQSIIRRPKNAHLASLGEMLHRQRFSVLFFYGGYSYFDNMRTFFRSNNYAVHDRTSLDREQISFENAWGVADEDLFNSALRVLDPLAAAKKPIFAHIMTTSNHRPFTYPDGRIDIPSPGRRRGAVRYTDYAIGRFIAEAQKRPWFRDTLFVIVADHCSSVAGKTELPVRDYQIPLIFYGPDIIKPGRVDRRVSQIDIAPTILDALGMAGDNNLFGKAVHEQTGPPRAFISNYQNLGYYKGDELIVLKPQQRIAAFHVDPASLESTPTDANPLLVEEAIAYYQTASRAFKSGKLELLWK